jgi:hypothetical protein
VKKFLITAVLLATPLVVVASQGNSAEPQGTPETGTQGSNSHHARHHRKRMKNSHHHSNHHKAAKQHSQPQ